MSAAPRAKPTTVFLIAGEESGDVLGAALIDALAARLGEGTRFLGVGGERMQRAGLAPIFPMDELAVIGLSGVLARLPRLVRRMRQAQAAILAAKPDVVVLVDAPAFNLRLARRVRRADPSMTVVDYVSPAVWAHNSWRARRTAQVVDKVMAILPFEPEVHRRLGGPPCVYVGHPLLQRLAVLRPAPGERPPLATARRPLLLVLPGSRRSEVSRLMTPFGAAVAAIAAEVGDVEVVLPAVERLRGEIETALASWPVKPTIVLGEAAKLAAFRRAHAALAASGTVTLELALSGVPMAVAYRIDPLVRPLKWMMLAHSIVLANLVLGENVIPELIDAASTPQRLAAAVVPLLTETPARAAQVAAFARLDTLMATAGRPADLAAEAVIETMRGKQRALARADADA